MNTYAATDSDSRIFYQRQVLVQLEDTPKAFAKFSPGLERATTLGHTRENNSTLKALARSR
jgi:hypothetical protein